MTHIKNFNNAKKTSQIKVDEMYNLKETDDVKRKAKDFEIALCAELARHNVPLKLTDCLVDLIKHHINDSEILKSVQLHEDKARYLINHGLGPLFEEEVVNKLKNCIAFGISFDESEVNKKTELEATVARLTPTNGPYIAKNSVPAGEIHDNSLAEILKLQSENASSSQKYPDIQTLQTPGYASVRLDANLDAIERRNQKMKQALNMQGIKFTR